ncbi:MAG: Long-chain-fatty-acid--CoA ligase [Myxococcales bacterium]|nr:Long-chain-fatty-acid--CoA ligase [Myxococcales bacterium]
MTFEPRFADLATMFHDVVTKYPDRPLFGTRDKAGWSWTTYAQFGSLVEQCRAGLVKRGVERGDRVAVISNNRLEWATGAYACYTLGAVYVPMYESQLDAEWKFILGDSDARLCLVSGDAVAKRVRAFAGELPTLQHVIDFDAADANGFAALMKDGAAGGVPAITPAADDVAIFIYTSGTTGKPKGVRLSHANLAGNVSGFQAVVPIDGAHRSLAFLPWAHVYGGSIELSGMISLGASLAICEKRERILEYIGEVKPTVLFAVPQIWNRIYAGVQANVAEKPKLIRNIFHAALRSRSKQKRGQSRSFGEVISLPLAKMLIFGKVKQRFGGKLEFACSGAAALSPDVAEFVDNLGIDVYEGYGMTETSGIACCNQPHARRIGTVGKPLPGVEIKLDHQAPGGDADNGEIIVYGTGVMLGYHNQPEETEKVMTPDAGLRTGDLGRFDSDGFLAVTGRVKELYKLQNGKYVAPAPLEEKLTLSPFIAQAMLHGSDKPYNVAVIVPNLQNAQKWAEENGLDATSSTAILSSPKMRELIAKELEKYSTDWKSYERIKKFVIADEEFTTANDMLTPTLKVKRRNVLKRYGGDLDKLYV